MEFKWMKDRLTGAYREVFEAVSAYGTLKGISKDVLEERLVELFDILLTAQTEGRDVRRVAGDDKERFCKDVFRDYTAWGRIKGGLEKGYNMAWVIFLLELLKVCTGVTADGWKEIKTDVLPYLLGIGGAVILWTLGNFILAPLMLKSKKFRPNTWNNMSFMAAVLISVGLVCLILKSSEAMWEIPTLWLAVGAGAYIAVYWVTRSVRRYRNYGTICNVHRQMRRDSYYKSLGNAQMERIILRAWQKRYKRLVAKGKTDPEDFTRRMKRDLRIDEKLNRGIDLFFAGIYLYQLVREVLSGEGLTDMLLFALIMGAVTFVVWIIFVKVFHDATAVRRKLIAQCEESGLNMPAFIEERLAVDE